MSGLAGSSGGFRRDKNHNDDSSSSRESSPKPGFKRGFTPNSDDEIVVPPIPDEDTPPPQGPLLRQAVGFSWDASTFTNAAQITTYEAAIPSKGAKSQYLLPGQEVVVPPPPKKVPRPKRKPGEPPPPRRSAYVKKDMRRSNDEFVDNQNTFRITQYDAGTPTNPPIHQGEGPYNSLFRVDTYKPPAHAAPPSAGVNIFRMSTGTPKPRNTKASRAKASGSKSAAGTSTPAKQLTPTVTSSATMSSAPSPINHSDSPGPSWTTLSPGHNRSREPSSTGEAKKSSHYRHDYGQSNMSTSQASQSESNFEPPQPDFNNEQSTFGSPTPSNATLTESSTANASESTSKLPSHASPDPANADAKKMLVPRRMITILIRDIRSGVDDDQLAEVKVPLRQAEDPADGFWTDAKDVCEQLQASPSRIDGPARVYTLRGKYRQFFLRVTEENKDIFTPVNVIVTPEKTLEVVVESPPTPGVAPLPPQIPADMRRSSTPESDYGSDEGPPQNSSNFVAHIQNEALKRKRASGGAALDFPGLINNGQIQQSFMVGPNGAVASDPTMKPPRKKRTYTKSADRVPAHPQTARLPSPKPNTDEETKDTMITNVISEEITNNPAWVEFMRSRLRPATVQNVLSQYRYAEALVTEWDGRRAPFITAHYPVEKKHILKVLRFSDKQAEDCKETMHLLVRHGPDGTCTQKETVKAMIEDTTPPKNGTNPIKRLLRFMREVDEEWNKANPVAMAQPMTRPPSNMLAGYSGAMWPSPTTTN